MAQKKKKEKEYVAATGLNYISNMTGEEIRVEKGDTIYEMNEISLGHELEAGHVIDVEEEQRKEEEAKQAEENKEEEGGENS